MYNLLDKKWLIGIRKDNTTELASIRDCIIKDYADVKSPDFHGYHFYVYDYLIIRLLSTITADILITAAERFPEDYEDSIDHYIITEMKNGKQSELFKRNAEFYFEKHHDRFELFDNTHPFMQFPVTDINGKEDMMMKLNPLAPANSGRLFPESLHSRKRNQEHSIIGFCDCTLKKNDIATKVKDQFVVTPQEAAHVVLYLASVQPGVGSGNKNALVGNAYVWETLIGQSLYETVLLNMPISGYLIDDEEPKDFGRPVWRWDSVKKKEEQIMINGKIKLLEGIFFPSRMIHMSYNGKSVTIAGSSIPKVLNDLFDPIRNMWAIKYEPHALIAQIKDTDKEEPKNPYRKLSPGDSLWLLMAATAQTKQTKLQEKRGKKVTDILMSAGASHHMQELASSEALNGIIQIRYHYRMADSKWVYYRTGVVEGKIPESLLKEPIRQNYLCRMEQYITSTKLTLKKQCKIYLANTTNNPTRIPNKEVLNKIQTGMYEKAFMDSIQNTFCGEHSFLYEISAAEDFEQVYDVWKRKIKQEALNQFSKLMDPTRMPVFWHCYEQLKKQCS